MFKIRKYLILIKKLNFSYYHLRLIIHRMGIIEKKVLWQYSKLVYRKVLSYLSSICIIINHEFKNTPMTSRNTGF